MAANNLKGLTVKIGGDTKELSDALKGVNKDITTLQADLRAVNSALKLDPGNVEAVAMKQELLTQAVDATREKLEILREAQRQADEQMANGTEVDQQAYRSLQAQIVRTSASLNDYERQISDLGDEADDTADNLDNLSDAADDADQQIEDAGDAAQEAADRFEELADSAREGVDQMSTGFGNLANGAKTMVTAITGAFAAVGGAMLYASESTVEYRTNMAKLETAFVDAGGTAETAAQKYKDFYGFLGDEGQATEATQHLAQLTTDQKSLSEWTNIARGAFSLFGSSLPIESMMEAANETSKTGQLTGALADALTWAGANEEEFQAKLDACTTTQEREALIRETLNGLYGEAGEKYQENAKDLIESNEAQARYTAAMAKFGKTAQPILTAVRNGFAMLIERAGAFLAEVDMDAITAAIDGAFAWFIDTAVPAIKDAIQWVIDHKDLILTMISAIGAGFVAWNVVSIVTGAIQAFTSFVSAIKLVTSGQMALNAVMSANPIGLIITAVAALVAAFIYLWNNCEEFRNFWINLWEQIKGYVEPVWDTIVAYFKMAWENIKVIWDVAVSYFSTIWEHIKLVFGVVSDVLSGNFGDAWEKIKQIFANWGNFFSGLWDGVKSIFANVDGFLGSEFSVAWDVIKRAFAPFVGYFQQIWNTVKGIFSAVKSVLSGNFSGAWEAIKGVFSGWGNFFSGLWDKVKGAFAGAISGMASIGNDIVRGLWNGINNMTSWVIGKIQSFGENVLGGIKRFFGIASPSKVMRDQVGRDLARGVGVGIEENADEALDPMDDLVSEMTGVNIDRNISNTFRGTAVNEFSGLSERLDAVVDYLSKYLPGLADNASQSIYLDGDTLVGTLGSRIDAELARQYTKKGRGQ